MARNVFFSFYYDRDIWRVNQVRQSWRFYPAGREQGYIDHSLWEKTRLRGKAALQDLIDDGLTNTSVTAVLIGYQTAQREWVQYEIEQSIARKKGLIGIYIHNLTNKDGHTDYQGTNPFDAFRNAIQQSGNYSGGIATYNWVNESGYSNIGDWVEKAAQQVGR